MLKLMIMPESRVQERSVLKETKGNVGSVLIRRTFGTEIKAEEGESRTLNFTISTDAVDRYGDTVAVDGWQLEAFRKNPVVLWMHDNMRPPLAKAASVRIEGGKLKASAEFTPLGMDLENDKIFTMLKTGFLSATSVGFVPLEYNFVDDPSRRFGIDFIKQELLEWSVVTVPANPEALIEGRSIEIPSPEEIKQVDLGLDRERLNLLRLRAA